MNLSYDRATILQGNKLRQENEERPTTFAEYNGAVDAQPSLNMDTANQRMAGPVGARAMELMTNPAAQAATNNWMNLFSQSNQGLEFNMAKQQQANAQAEVAVLDAEVDGRIS